MTELNGLRIAVTDANASNIDLDTHHRSFTQFKRLVISLSIMLNEPLSRFVLKQWGVLVLNQWDVSEWYLSSYLPQVNYQFIQRSATAAAISFARPNFHMQISAAWRFPNITVKQNLMPLRPACYLDPCKMSYCLCCTLVNCTGPSQLGWRRLLKSKRMTIWRCEKLWASKEMS